MYEKSENFNSLRPILFELFKKNYRGGQIDPPPSRNRVNISGNYERTDTADHILEMAGLGLFCDYFFTTTVAKIRIPILNATS